MRFISAQKKSEEEMEECPSPDFQDRTFRLRRSTASAATPPSSPARTDSTGKPGIGAGVTVVVTLVLVLVVTVPLVEVEVDVSVAVIVVVDTSVDVVVPVTTSGPYFRIIPPLLTIHPSSGPTMNTELRPTDSEGGTGNVAITSQVRPSQCTITLAPAAFSPTAQPSEALTIWTE